MLQKQNVNINFQQGIDTKLDPFQLPPGKFVNFENAIFDKVGKAVKRNGFQELTQLPQSASYLTTYQGNLTAIGSSVLSYSQGSNSWINNGNITPLQLSTESLIKNGLNQTQCDATVSNNSQVCTVYTEYNGSVNTYKFVVADVNTGQNIIAPTALTADATYGAPKVFYLGTYFIVVYTSKIASNYLLQYIAINTVTLNVASPITIVASYAPSSTQAFDGVVYNNQLYVAFNGATTGVNIVSLSATLNLSSSHPVDGSHAGTLISVNGDSVNNRINVSYYDSVSTNGYAASVNPNTLAVILTPTAVITGVAVLNLTSFTLSGVNYIYYEVSNNYSYDSSIPTHYIQSINVTATGTVSSVTTIIRSVGLASKAFTYNGQIYFWTVYQSPYQPTYFLIQGNSLQSSPQIIAKLAYENSGGYLTSGIPSVYLNGNIMQFAYLFKDLVTSVNKNTNIPAGQQTAGIYSQTGINLATIDFTFMNFPVIETAGNLLLGGGFVQMFDGYQVAEQNFFLYPDSIEATWSATGGSIHAQPDGSTNANAYFYQAVYEWADNQGNIFKSAPSIPISVTTSGSGTAGSITVNIPYLRLTLKVQNPVKITLYRWSVAQQVYYEVTSVIQPTLNLTTSDSIVYIDTLADATILGNALLYTTGGVLEDANPPAAEAMTLWDTRAWLIDAENPDLLYYSKTLVENTPVEFSPELTYFISPSVGAQRATGVNACIFPMDDKLIVFKKESGLFYINGTGPDSTGANSGYSEPILITSSVGCDNPNSIVLTQTGLMFQASGGKGIWLLDRGMNTSYIGSRVEQYNSNTVVSANSIPSANRILFNLDNGIVLMYDYFVGQWGTFNNASGISACLYQDLFTYMSPSYLVTPPSGMPYVIQSSVFQESPGTYLDGSNPTLMSFTTGWINLAGLQGYKKAYFFELLGQYFSPHKLNIQIAYNYDPNPKQSFTVTPTNFSVPWGNSPSWGTSSPQQNESPWGGPSNVEQNKNFFKYKLCESFQLTITEIYDASYGVPAGQGFSLSGLDLVVGLKKGYKPLSAKNMAG